MGLLERDNLSKEEVCWCRIRDVRDGFQLGLARFEFQQHGMSAEECCSRLDGFFVQLPKDFRYAVEIRNAGLLGTDYHKVLETHGVAHVFNHWSYMPPLAEQHKRTETFTAPFTVLRLLTPLKISYEAAKKRAEPYTKIIQQRSLGGYSGVRIWSRFWSRCPVCRNHIQPPSKYEYPQS